LGDSKGIRPLKIIPASAISKVLHWWFYFGGLWGGGLGL